MRVVLLDDWEGRLGNSAPVQRLRKLCTVEVYKDRARDEQALLERLKGVPIVIAVRERTHFPAEILEKLSDLRLLAQTGGGLAHVDVEAAKRLGIRIATTPGSSNASVAELVFTLMLSLQRFVLQGDRDIRQGRWSQRVGKELAGKTLGILGYGNIGRQLVPIAKAFRMELLAWGREASRQRSEADGVDFEPDLPRFMSRSNLVSVHLRLTKATRGMINKEILRAMSPESILINTSRGEVIVEDDLIEALQDGTLAAAGLDVFKEEPLPADHPFTKLENVILTPHIGWITEETFHRFIEQSVRNIENYLAETPSLDQL